MKEELRGETENMIDQTRVYFNVYKTSLGLYIDEDLCTKYNVGNQSNKKEIKEHICCLVNEDDLDTITQKTKDSSKVLIPNIIKIFDLQLVLSFTVYVDVNHDNKLYVSDNTYTRYNITPQSKRMINNATYGNITEEDLDTIEKESEKEKVKLKRNYKEIELPDEIKPADYLFLLYSDSLTKRKYISRYTYELFKSAEIEIEGEPKIIDNKNCYSITEKQLKDAEEKLHYRGVEFLLRPKTTLFPLGKPYPNMHYIEEIVQRIYDFQKRKNLFAHIKVYEDKKVNDDIRPYLDRIMPVLGDEDHIREVLGDDDIIKAVIDDVHKKPIIIYRDTKSANLYIPTEEKDATITIMNKPCKEISFEEIKELNKETVIATVYLTKKKEYDILVCNNNGQLFVSHAMISKLGFYIEKPHRIMVNKEIYEEISPEDIDIIKELESDDCHINIIMKQIAPK